MGSDMRLIAEELSGERGGQPVFSDVGFSLGAGAALVVTGPNGAENRPCFGLSLDCCRR